MTSNWGAENIPDLAGKISIVTGANRGIGYAAARALACKGAAVILACRGKDKGEAAVQQIVQECPGAKAELIQLDLSDLASVRRFAGEFTSRYNRLDILINNANLLFTYELQRRFEGAGVDTIAAAAHPGWTATDLPANRRMIRMLNPIIGQTPEMGALPALYAAVAPDVSGGSYYGPRSWGGLRGYPTRVQSSDSSHDTAVAVRLWRVSEELTGVRYHIRAEVQNG